MDTLGPRIMVNVGTQAISTTGLNPRDLAPLTNDAFLATFTGKTPLSASNGISRQHNNYRQSYTTQMERVTIRTKTRPLTANGNESMEPDSAILSIIRGNGTDGNQQQTSQRPAQGTRNRRRSFNQQMMGNDWNDIPCSPNYRPTNDSTRRRRTRSGGAQQQQQQQISVVDQMAAQPHIPYAILPKRFEPKQIATNGLPQQQQSRPSNNNNTRNGGNRRGGAGGRRPQSARRSQRQQDYYDDQWVDEQDDDLWLEPMPSMMNRRFTQRSNRMANAGYYGPHPRMNNYYDSYSYGPMSRQGQLPVNSRRRMPYQNDAYMPFNIVPTYDLNEWQGPYARSRQNLYFQQQQRNGVRSGNGFIRDDHRANGTSRQTRNGKQSKSPRNTKGGQQKRRTSRQRKQRNQNSKTEGTPLTTTNDAKSTNETETSNEDKQKQESNNETDHHQQQQDQPLAPRDHENKENEGEQKSE